jgi:hypothetical protein
MIGARGKGASQKGARGQTPGASETPLAPGLFFFTGRWPLASGPFVAGPSNKVST